MNPPIAAEAGGVSRAVREGEVLTVGSVASMVGVSVRTLHHWDDTGVVCPTARTEAGYRAYCSSDVARIQRVLVYRELGFSLAEISNLLDDPDTDELAHLRRQRDLLVERIDHLRNMVSTIEGLIKERSRRDPRNTADQAALFGSSWRRDWAEEAEDRWGDSEQWLEYVDTTTNLTPEERDNIRAEGEAVYHELARAKRMGHRPGDRESNALAERHRAMIGRLFDCSYSMHVLMGRMYVEDQRFRKNLDAVEQGMSRWLSAVIDANARAHGIDPDTAKWE